MKPPIPATPEEAPCPHAMWCVNCKGLHSASDKQCPFWRHCFDSAWLSARIAGALEVADVDPELRRLLKNTHKKGKEKRV
jgi:hypothetical protein